MAAKGDFVPTHADASELHLDKDFWDHAKVMMPAEEGKERISFRVDRDVLRWFKKRGKGYQTRMNAVLRSFYEAHKHGSN